MSSQFTYINSTLPRSFAPPQIEKHTTLSIAELGKIIASNDVVVQASAEGSIAERILSIFEQDEVHFGPVFIPDHRAEWIEKIGYFVDQNLPLEFVSMAFPYKVPNPLKSDRKAPDLGEALMLRRFKAVLDAVESVYAPGGRLTVLEEGILGRCQGVDPASIAAYRAGIDNCVAISEVPERQLCFHSLDDMVEKIPNFEARWLFEQERMRELWQQGDEAVVGAYNETVPPSKAAVPTQDFPPDVVAHAYDPEQKDSALRYAREYIDKIAHRKFFAYRSILALRDSTGYLHNLRPHALKLTVSPKPENLAVVPVNTWSRILPYHGVPVLDTDGRWYILYWGGLGESVGALEALHLDGDADAAPIGYRVLE
jgi:hypothetical protein